MGNVGGGRKWELQAHQVTCDHKRKENRRPHRQSIFEAGRKGGSDPRQRAWNRGKAPGAGARPGVPAGWGITEARKTTAEDC